jgi:geranylgeranyl reductase family protein
MTWDAVIVGAGPAGSIAALRLAAAGRTTLLLDRRPFPREKVCGDALLPDALACLRRNGLFDLVREEALLVQGLTVRSPAGVAVDLDGTTFLTLERERLDALLAGAAVAAGATSRAARVTAVVDGSPARVTLEDGEELRARVVVVATGADVSLLEPLGLVQRRRASAAAVRRYYASGAAPRRLLISYDRAVLPGYGWVFPLPGGRCNVGVGVFFGRRGARDGGGSLRALFDAFVRDGPAAREVALRASETGPLHGAALRCGLTGLAARRGAIIAAGETLGATFPFTGEGIGKAMETGEQAARAVEAALVHGQPGMLKAYARKIERELRPRFAGYGQAAAWMAHPRVADLVFRRAARSPWLREQAEAILAETVDPGTVFNLRGLLGSFFR